jgi:hypothetical protein
MRIFKTSKQAKTPAHFNGGQKQKRTTTYLPSH